PRLLLARRGRGRAAGREPARHSLLRLKLRRRFSGGGHRPVYGSLSPGAHAEPLHQVQRDDQIRVAAAQGVGPGRAGAGDRPLRTHRVRPGAIVDEAGVVVGEHDGIAMYTVGQRSGLRLQASGPASAPRYVSAIDGVTNTIRVGAPDELLRSSGRVEDVRYVEGIVPTA